MLKKRIKLNIPLSEISYHEPGIGFSFKWNRLRLLLPYLRLPLTASLGPLLEEFKSTFDGDVTFFLEGHRLNFNIEITDIKVNEEVIHRFSRQTSRIEEVIKQIKFLLDQENLTFEKAQIILYQKGFQFDDPRVHSILTRIIDTLPPRKVVEKVPFPLSNLHYHSRGIHFYNKETQFDVDKSRLPVEVGPALERIKGNFTGNIVFHIETSYLLRWNSTQGHLQSGQMSREIKGIEIPPNLPTAFRILRNRFIVEAVKTSIANRSISPENIKTLLEDWGLSIKHQEIGLELLANIETWTEEKDIRVPLQDIVYQDDYIVVPVEGHNMKISALNLAFETHRMLDNFKQSLEGDIGIHLYQPLHFKWDEEKEHLAIEPQKSVKIKLNIDEDTVKRLKKLHWLVVEKGINIGADGTLLEQFPFPEEETGTGAQTIEESDETSGVEIPPRTTTESENVGEKPSREENETITPTDTPAAKGFTLDLPRPIEKIPYQDLENQKYDIRGLQVLEGMADKMYMTTQDLWFRIGNRLIWERPGLDSATYLFEWPEEDLEFFVGKIWVSELKEIREDKEGTGYITRVSHTPGDLTRWKSNLQRALKKIAKK